MVGETIINKTFHVLVKLGRNPSQGRGMLQPASLRDFELFLKLCVDEEVLRYTDEFGRSIARRAVFRTESGDVNINRVEEEKPSNAQELSLQCRQPKRDTFLRAGTTPSSNTFSFENAPYTLRNKVSFPAVAADFLSTEYFVSAFLGETTFV